MRTLYDGDLMMMVAVSTAHATNRMRTCASCTQSLGITDHSHAANPVSLRSPSWWSNNGVADSSSTSIRWGKTSEHVAIDS